MQTSESGSIWRLSPPRPTRARKSTSIRELTRKRPSAGGPAGRPGSVALTRPSARRRGGAGGGRRGAGGQAGGGEPASSHPISPQLCHAAPPPLSRGSSPPQTHRGVAPDRPPTARGGRGALRTRLALPLSPPPGPIPRRTGGGEAREPGAGRGEAPAPLSEPTALMILPQVHLRKPCYDFYFL